MISRYNRRPVSHKLEIRGLSRSRLDEHPLPEEADDDQSSQHDLRDLRETGSGHNSSETSAASGCSACPTVVSVDSSRCWSGTRSSTGTGFSTERSSVFSWGYDEFDKAASRQVQRMFEEIDKELYEGSGAGAGILQGLQDECQQWATRFPHLRLVGTQLVRPGDEGFQWYSTSGKSSSESLPSAARGSRMGSPQREEGRRDLNVQGRRAALLQSSSANLDGLRAGCHSQDMQRVVEVEGLMEEYLAFDSRDLGSECEQDRWESGPRHRCLPPVSPRRCRRQAVLDLLFDDVWQQLVGCMKELVQHQWECCSLSHEKTSGSLGGPPGQQDSQSSVMLLSAVPAMVPRVGHSRVPPITAGQHLQNKKSGGAKHKSSRRKQKRPSSAGRLPAGAASAQHRLNDLMVIHSIPLQQRNLSLWTRNQDTEERQGHGSASSTVLSGRPGPRRALEQSSSSLSRPPQSARRRNPPPRTLLPLAPSSSHTGSMDEVVRGTRLAAANGRLSRGRNPLLLLPPIGSGEPDPSQPAQRSQAAQQPQKGPRSRTQSALNHEAGGPVPRDRHHPLDSCSRPNTTLTYRSDTPYRRSFTLLDSICQGRPGRASVATDSLGFGVTGISLGFSSSSFLDSFCPHPLGHLPIKDEEEPDPRVPDPRVLAPKGPNAKVPDPQVPAPQLPDPRVPDPPAPAPNVPEPKVPGPALVELVSVPPRPQARGGGSSRGSRTGP